MLQGAVCPVTAGISALGILSAALAGIWSKVKPTAARFAAVTAFIFAGQMMNFPIQDGTSGHLLGGVLASALLGTPFGILSMAIVLTVQCLVFSDGGFTVLGANIFNMALIGAGLGGFLHSLLVKKIPSGSFKYAIGLGSIAWLSVLAAALSCSIELALAGTIGFSKVAGAMLSTHSLIGLGEAFITVGVCFVFAGNYAVSTEKRSVIVPLSAAAVIATMLSPFASGFPDGLEWVAEKYQFLHDSAPAFVSPLADYSFSAVSNEAFSTGLAGLTGVGITFLIAFILLSAVLRKSQPQGN
jgi:cobalt/nickel transport system permease protein